MENGMVAAIAQRNWRTRLMSCAWLVCAILLVVALRVMPVNAQGGTPQAAEPPPLMKVSKVSMPTPSGQPVERIVVERADPQMAYVPVYDPAVAYGAWPYPAYPPYYYEPPGWVPGTFAYGAMGFAAGAVVGAA